jgi:hypothetical protein
MADPTLPEIDVSSTPLPPAAPAGGAPPGVDPGVLAALNATNLSPDQISATKKDLTEATAGEKRVADLEEQNAGEKFQGGQPPQFGQNLMGRMAPLLLFSAFGGAKSKQFAGQGLASMTGAIQGFLKGDQEAYKDSVDKYNQNFEQWQEHQKALNTVYDKMREAYKGRIDADIKALQFARQVTGDEVKNQTQMMMMYDRMQMAFDQLSLKQQEFAHREMEDQVHDSFTARKIQDMEKKVQGGGGQLDENGKWFVDQVAAAGDLNPLQRVQSRYGGALAAATFNDLGKQYRDQGLDPREFTGDKAETASETSVMRTASQRLAAVERLTGSVKSLEPTITDLIRKVNGNGAMTMNQLFNAVKKQFGDEELSRLQTLITATSRQYFEAATMPGSNAQMHQGAQDKADSLMNGSLSLANWTGRRGSGVSCG